jgi:hypothetical protein
MSQLSYRCSTSLKQKYAIKLILYYQIDILLQKKTVMDTTKLKIQAIAELEACNERLAALLDHAPMLKAQADNALGRLINGLKVAAGALKGDTTAEQGQPLTHIAGVPIGGAKAIKKKDFLPTVGSITDLELLAKKVIADIRLGGIPAVIIEKHGDKAVRAAAAMVGLDVTATHPERVEPWFIADIYNKMADDDERDRQVREADEAAATAALEENKEPEAIIIDDPKGDDAAAIEREREIEALQAKHDDAIAAFNIASQVLEDAEKAKAALPEDATPQQKGAATKVINEASKALEAAGLARTAAQRELQEAGK